MIVSAELSCTEEFLMYAQHLAEQQRLAQIIVDEAHLTITANCYRRSMADLLHIPATRDQAPVAQAGPGILAGAQAADGLLRANCSAVISCSPALTFGVLESARRLGLDVPQDLSLLTVGEMPDADVVHPPLSQVTFDWGRLAQTAISELERLMAGARTLPDYSVAPELVLRSSELPVRTR